MTRPRWLPAYRRRSTNPWCDDWAPFRTEHVLTIGPWTLRWVTKVRDPW